MKVTSPYSFKDVYERILDAANVRTQTEVAQLLDIKQSSISDAKGKNVIPDGWLLKLYQKYKLEPDWVLYGLGPRSLHDPALGVAEGCAVYAGSAPEAIVYAMSATDPEDGNWKRLPTTRIPLMESYLRDKLIVTQMDNASMEPIIRQEAYVGLDAGETMIKSGEIYALSIKGEGLVIKRAVRDLEIKMLILYSENPSHQPQRIPLDSPDYVCIGKVTWVMQAI